MLNVVTVHWQSPDWVEPQLRYLEQHAGQPFRVFASLNGIDDPDIWKRFHYAADLEGTHAEKLNELARTVVARADPSDLLLFLDGDAFPVRPMAAWMRSRLHDYPLVAVRRDENLGDRQPHPCFCVTTSGFWKEIDGDWREGGTWTNSAGVTTTDVGGNLLHNLADRGQRWLPLRRTNTHDANALWFGVYDHRVYHHGAGFRPRVSRVGDHADTVERVPLRGSGIKGLALRAVRQPSSLLGIRPRHALVLPRAAVAVADRRKQQRVEQRQARRRAEEERYERAVFARLLADPEFFREFDSTPV